MAKKQENKIEKQETAVAPVMPDYMKQFMAQSGADTSALISSSISVPRLSYRGKRWRFIVDGEEEVVKELTVDVVIVGVEPDAGRFVKTYYKAAYNPGDSSPPDCSSSNGVGPDAWVSSPVAQRCNQCPNNVFGSAASRTGGKAKACHDSKRLWVVRPGDMDIVYGLNVPIMTLKNLAEYGKYIARNNYPLALVITELGMDDEAEFPKLTFAFKGFVEEDYVKEAVDLNTTRPWRTISAPIVEVPMITDANMPTMGTRNGTESVLTPPRKTGGEGIDTIIGDWK
jgi:hypothetical protein